MAHNGKLYQIQEAMLLKNVRFIPSTLIKTNLRQEGLAILLVIIIIKTTPAYKRPKFLEIIEHYWYKYVYSMGSSKLRRGASAESPERTGEKKIWGIP